MKEQETPPTWGCVLNFFTFLLLVILCVWLGSCTPREIVRERLVHDTLKVTKVEKDSVIVKDSVSRVVLMKGDTIWVSQDRWLTRYVEKVRVDTVYKALHDTIRAETVVEKNKPPSLWGKIWAMMKALFIFFVLVIVIKFLGVMKEVA